MARLDSSRKYLMTINNPVDHGFTHENIKKILSGFSGLEYWCLCDEVGEEKTPHIHVYVLFQNAVMFTTMKKRFYEAHIDKAYGSNQENRDYIRKEGKWLDDEKHETNLIDTFEESGELPPDRDTSIKETAAILEMVRNGASDYEILDAFPNAMNKLDKMERARQIIQAERYKNEFRKLKVIYLYGKTGVGKTRSIMEKYGYENCYRVTNYEHPFDGYKGQPIIIFEEFRSSLPISDMLIYLDGYPTMLPCRYADKQACYHTVYIISNIPLERQYPNIQIEEPGTWDAFKRRINESVCKMPPESNVLAWANEPYEEDRLC